MVCYNRWIFSQYLKVCLLATRHLKVKPEVLDAELPPVDVVVLHPLLLDGDVGQVNEKVVHLSSTVVVLHRAEPGG